MNEKQYKVCTPWFRPYSEVQTLLKILPGVNKTAVKSMVTAINEQMGTPQNPVDWTDPNTWIGERLKGNDAQLAQHIWQESKYTVSPRYLAGSLFLIHLYKLLVPDADGVYHLSERGKLFSENDLQTVREIDDAEGILQLLIILATKNQARRSDILPEWGDFLHVYSKFGTDTTIKDSLSRHLVNVIERKLVLRTGNSYKISPEGLTYITDYSGSENYTAPSYDPSKKQPPIINPKREVLLAAEAFNLKQRQEFKQKLSGINPYRFEHLVRELLEAMGYDVVTVTRASGDYGVDVVATVQFGITTITEVVQVKRRQDTITRPILDQLRGALPYYKALRGTIITLGTFSSGCIEAALFAGAAPIGLIDGEKLLDLLIKYDIGVKKRPINLYELNEEYFTAADELLENEKTLSEELE